uniref:glutathione hydrolase 7-like isoform X1 n=2 Tax=Styela clava TaxID=7725 RepID=UPI001939AD38|nr:glutathione hydrolase 7-like isoform X1 [Styela clava]
MDLGGRNNAAPFEVVFRGADDTAPETVQMNEFVVANSSTDTSDLDNGTSTSDRLYTMQQGGSSGNNYLEEDSPLRETRSDPFNKPRWWREASSLSIIIASMIIFCVGITIAMIIQILVGAPQVIPHAGVLSDDDQCSKIGIRVLSESADSTYPTASSIDATILTSLCLIVKNIHKGGLGGGGFMLIEKQHDAKHDIVQIDFREISPMKTETPNVTREEVKAEQSVAVPGYIHGMKAAHEKFGKAPWENIFQQASKLAAGGVLISEEVSEAISKLDITSIPEDLKNLVTNGTGSKLLKTNDTLKQPELAKTFQIIGENPDSFYAGRIADSLVTALNKGGSKMQKQDLKNYKAITNTDVLRVKYGDMSVSASSPPSSGPVILSALNYLSHYPINKNFSSDYLLYHRMLEAVKYSFGYQSSWETTEQVNESFSNPAVVEQIVDNKTFPIVNYLNDTQPLSLNKGGEQHVTVVGYDGYIVTIVMGIGTPFGSKIMSGGFILNNAMLDFCWPGKGEELVGLQNSEANMIAGSKRPMSSMSAVLGLPAETKCGLYLGFDAHEADSAISALLQTVIRKQSGMDLSNSITSGRLDQESYPFNVMAEESVSSGLVGYLKSLGHNVTQLSSGQSLGVCHSLTYFEGLVKFYEDPRDADDGAYVF